MLLFEFSRLVSRLTWFQPIEQLINLLVEFEKESHLKKIFPSWGVKWRGFESTMMDLSWPDDLVVDWRTIGDNAIYILVD